MRGPNFGPSVLKLGLACTVANADASVENSTDRTFNSSEISEESA